MCRLSDLPGETRPWAARVGGRFGAALVALLAIALSATTSTGAPARNRLDRILAEYAERQTRFSADMRALADFCDQNAFPDDAARIRTLAAPIEEQTADIDRLPEKVQPDIPKGLKPI